jgi:hypothetical protein
MMGPHACGCAAALPNGLQAVGRSAATREREGAHSVRPHPPEGAPASLGAARRKAA